MINIIGAVINAGIIIYLGLKAQACLGGAQMENVPLIQNPLILSFIAIVALFLVHKHK